MRPRAAHRCAMRPLTRVGDPDARFRSVSYRTGQVAGQAPWRTEGVLGERRCAVVVLAQRSGVAARLPPEGVAGQTVAGMIVARHPE